MTKTSFLFFLFLTGCASLFGVNITKEDLDKNFTLNFNRSKSKCFAGTASALKEMKIEIKDRNESKGEIRTERTECQRYTNTTGTASKSGNGARYDGVSSTNVFYHRYIFNITGDNDKCTVKVATYQIWKDNEVLDKVDLPYVQKNYWDPLKGFITEEVDRL